MRTRRRFSGDTSRRTWGWRRYAVTSISRRNVTRHKFHPHQVRAWKRCALERMKEVLSKGPERSAGGAGGDWGANGGAGLFGQGAQVVRQEELRGTIGRSHRKPRVRARRI